MSIYEYNEAEEKEKMRLAEREYGYELGREEGREVGREEGRKEGRAVGRKEVLEVDLRKIMKNLKLTLDQAMDILEIPSQDREKYLLQFSK